MGSYVPVPGPARGPPRRRRRRGLRLVRRRTLPGRRRSASPSSCCSSGAASRTCSGRSRSGSSARPRSGSGRSSSSTTCRRCPGRVGRSPRPALLTVAVMTSGYGLFMLGLVGLDVLLDPRRRRWILPLVVPAGALRRVVPDARPERDRDLRRPVHARDAAGAAAASSSTAWPPRSASAAGGGALSGRVLDRRARRLASPGSPSADDRSRAGRSPASSRSSSSTRSSGSSGRSSRSTPRCTRRYAYLSGILALHRGRRAWSADRRSPPRGGLLRR